MVAVLPPPGGGKPRTEGEAWVGLVPHACPSIWPVLLYLAHRFLQVTRVSQDLAEITIHQSSVIHSEK